MPWRVIQTERSRSAAAPTSAQAPQLMLRAGRPRPRRWCASASRNALAAAWLPCPGDPRSDAPEENSTKKSSGRVRVSSWRIQPAQHLGREHPLEAAPVLALEHRVVQSTGGMHDAAQRGHRPVDLAQDGPDAAFVGDVAGEHARASAPAASISRSTGTAAVGGAPTPDQDEVPGAVGDHASARPGGRGPTARP